MQQGVSGVEDMVIRAGTLLLQLHSLVLNCSDCWVCGDVPSFWMYNFLPAAVSWQISLLAGVWNLIDWLALFAMLCYLETARGLSSNCSGMLQLSTILGSLCLTLPRCRIQSKLVSASLSLFLYYTRENRSLQHKNIGHEYRSFFLLFEMTNLED